MLEKVEHARNAPRRLHEVGREQPRDRYAEVGEGAPHEDQRQHEIGRRHADVVDHGQQVVDGRARVHRRVDAGRDRDDPGEDEGQERQDHREHQAFADQLGVRALVLEREAEVPLREILHPFQVLDPYRPVEPVLAPERLDLLGADGAARRRECRHVGREEVARRRLHDCAHGDREEEEQRRQEDEPPQDVSGHRRPIFAR